MEHKRNAGVRNGSPGGAVAFILMIVVAGYLMGTLSSCTHTLEFHWPGAWANSSTSRSTTVSAPSQSSKKIVKEKDKEDY